MWKHIALACVLTASTTGCLVDMLMSTAIEGKLHADSAKSATNALNYAKEQTGSMGVEQALQAYKAEKGVNPPSLEALVPEYCQSIPTQPDGSPYGYDPSTGALLTGPQPVANDNVSLAKIREAINKYGTAIGYYPPTLQALVPTYIDSVPKASNGEDFIYYAQDGTLINPATTTPATRAQANQGRPMVGGGGPMGEAMTGIAIQNDLNNMSNAGASAAGTRMRGNGKATVGEHNQRELDAINQLGL